MRIYTAAVLFALVLSRVVVADCVRASWETRLAPAVVHTSYSLRNMAVADFDGDGLLDGVVVRRVPTETVMLQRGLGNGFFASPIDVFASPKISDFFAGDLNGDAKPDLLFLDDSKALLAFLAGNGDGTFAEPVDTAVSTGELFAVAELTGDDIADVAAFNSNAEGHWAVLFAGNGSGGFAEVRRLPLAAPPYAIAAGDLDGDNANDLVVGYADVSSLDLLFGNGDGTFDPVVRRESGNWATQIRLADMENDGDLDILAANYFDPPAMHRNRGGRQFDAVIRYPLTPPQPSWNTNRVNDIIPADVNGDGTLDLLISGGHYVATLRGLGDGVFADPSFDHEYHPGFVSGPIGAAADLNNDGRVDLMTVRTSLGRMISLINHCGEATVTLTSSTPAISAGQSASVRVTTQGYDQYYTPPFSGSGTVTILEGQTVLASGTLSNGEVSLSIPGLAPGAHKLFARYSGDDQYEPAESMRIVVRVTSSNPAATPPPRRRAVRP